MDIRSISIPYFITSPSTPAAVRTKIQPPRAHRKVNDDQLPQSAPRICYVWINGISMPVPLD